MKKNIPEQLTEKSKRFWDALFHLLDYNKNAPIMLEGELAERRIDDDYILRMNRDNIWIVKEAEGRARCIEPFFQKDDFPYCKILEWYLKDSVLSRV